MLRRIFAILLCMALLMGLAGCGAKREFYYEEPVEATSIAVPEATVPADGNPNDVTCQGSYSVSDAEITVSRDAVVATMDGANLTNGQLQIYYWLEVASYRLENHEVEPDFSQSLDTQICPIDSSVGSWQQYFLKQALATWHTHQALVFLGRDEGTPTEEEYKPDLEKRKEYMTGMPATEYLYQWSESYKPNRLHQAYLDGIPEMLSTMAVDNGFADNDAQAKAIAGVGAQGSDLVSYTHTANMAYMYFTEMGYHFEPTAEEIEAYYQEALSSEPIPEGKTVEKPAEKPAEAPIEKAVAEKPATTQKQVTDIVTSQIVLTTLAEKHYGSPWFWVYIYEENKSIISNPNNIKPGTRVVIPPPEKYGINPNDKASLKKAQVKSWQYLKGK